MDDILIQVSGSYTNVIVYGSHTLITLEGSPANDTAGIIHVLGSIASGEPPPAT